MNKIMKIMKEQKVLLDFINVLLGIIAILLLILLFLHPNKEYILITILFISGLMNLINGLRKLRDKKKTVGISLIITAAIILLIAVILAFF